jgi:peroxiredoxin
MEFSPQGQRPQNFTLHITSDQTLTFSDLLGRPVVLAFYPADWSPVCGGQMALYSEILPELRKFGAELLGISVDGAGVRTRLQRTVICISRRSKTV